MKELYLENLGFVHYRINAYYFCPLGGSVAVNNPIWHQKFAYKKLNEHRIKNLIARRGTDKKQTFPVGQFFTLNDEVPRGELQEKNDIPVHKELYKMVAVHKDGFSLGVQNILTGSVQEILHSKLSPLNLELLEELSYSTPQLYKNLVKLTNLMRNKYKPGYWRQQGFQQLHYGIGAPLTGDAHYESIHDGPGGGLDHG